MYSRLRRKHSRCSPGADRAMECVLSWTLPTESVFGDPFTAEQTVESVAVYRDGGEAPVATLKGAVSEFTDTEATGLTSGYHTYSVKVTVAVVESPAVEVRSSRYVGRWLLLPCLPSSSTLHPTISTSTP